MNGLAIPTGLSTIFDPLLCASLQTALVIVVVLALRKVLGPYLPARWLHAMWLVVIIRTALPWTPEVA
ncbi:MAG TPA: hypothetical protein PL151_02070 [Phycisphaerae bacterium]|nr:hypothetical protein [Phycisphaerae bacterium]HOJ73077.1 hypothetical protein [Phycisphaerae bacterium]HOM52693.1 hypothetical protein [Phycisphaerae bacterium]HON66043.1 hypothetical protein [Phycisphaerae bacterium]HOQ85052.1 hypothetical protein [Phycisphaerae bacterium]